MLKRVRLDTSGFTTITAMVNAAAKTAILETAISIRDEAKSLAPVDTEYLKESIYVVSEDHSDYDEARSKSQEKYDLAKAAGSTPKGIRMTSGMRYNFFPSIAPENPMEVWVVVGAEHGEPNEYGTPNRGAQAFLTPAVWNHRAYLSNAIRVAYKGLSVKAKFSTFSEFK